MSNGLEVPQLFQFSKAQLVKAFEVYNSEFLENSEEFDEIKTGEYTACQQAEKLLSILLTLA